MPRVSVLIPAHNAAHILPDALASLVAQSFEDWEAVVVDDASTDSTFEVAQASGDSRVRVIRCDENRGPAGARNLAAAESSGELVALLDADDAWMPEYLERQVSCFDAEEARSAGVGIVACDARVVTEDGVEVGTHLKRLPIRVDGIDIDRMLRGNAVYISALFPRVAGEEAGWFDRGLRGTEDHDLWLRILETGRRAVLNREALAIYRLSHGSVASNLGHMARGEREALARALARGRLTRRQRRIARAEIRYYRAMERIAEAAFERRILGVARDLPLIAYVVMTYPRRWPGWWRALRAGGRVT